MKNTKQTLPQEKLMGLAALRSSPVGSIKGRVTVPGDKSISHRALMLASQAVGKTKITGLLESEDVFCVLAALQSMGVSIVKDKDGSWLVSGLGTGGLQEPEGVLNMGNSGTGARLLMGLVSSYNFTSMFDGDASLRKRPMTRVINPLEQLGAGIIARKGGLMPLTIRGAEEPMPIIYEVPAPSAQVKSAIMLAAMNIPGKTTVIEKENTRDHTELMMKYMGVDVEISEQEGKKHITVTGPAELSAKDIIVPADPSSAAFLVVAALITPDSELVIENVCLNPARIGLYQTLQEMGAEITFINEREQAGERIADIKASSSRLKGVDVPAERAPSMIDEYPILAVAASVAAGKTKMHGLAELKVKESDRLSAIADALRENGVDIELGEDSLAVNGSQSPAGGGAVKTHMDHRIAMSFLVLGMVAENPVTIDDGSMIKTSFPAFVDLMNSIGADINEVS